MSAPRPRQGASIREPLVVELVCRVALQNWPCSTAMGLMWLGLAEAPIFTFSDRGQSGFCIGLLEYTPGIHMYTQHTSVCSAWPFIPSTWHSNCVRLASASALPRAFASKPTYSFGRMLRVYVRVLWKIFVTIYPPWWSPGVITGHDSSAGFQVPRLAIMGYLHTN